MKRVQRSVLFGATLGLMGCIVPTPFSTHTDVITPADSTPVLGRQVAVRLFDQPITLGWADLAFATLPTMDWRNVRRS